VHCRTFIQYAMLYELNLTSRKDLSRKGVSSFSKGTVQVAIASKNVSTYLPSSEYPEIPPTCIHFTLVSRVRMNSMQSAILFHQFRPSVRLSVRPIPVLCLNEYTYRHTFYRSTLCVISAVFAVVRCPSVCPSVCHVGGLYPHG